jgi:hypothetical protein
MGRKTKVGVATGTTTVGRAVGAAVGGAVAAGTTVTVQGTMVALLAGGSAGLKKVTEIVYVPGVVLGGIWPDTVKFPNASALVTPMGDPSKRSVACSPAAAPEPVTVIVSPGLSVVSEHVAVCAEAVLANPTRSAATTESVAMNRIGFIARPLPV